MNFVTFGRCDILYEKTVAEKPDMLIIQADTHDHGEDLNTLKKVKKLL